MQGISSKALSKPENKYKYNGKELQDNEFSDGSGLEEYDFHYRYYDDQLGVFHNQDRLASKFSYMSPYQFCSDNPIWLKEIDGLEGVKYNETDQDGNQRTVVEKNVVVILRRTRDIPTTASQRRFNRMTRQNERIEKRNVEKIEAVRTQLNEFYNGSNSNGTENSAGQRVYFKFNVTGVRDFDHNNMKPEQVEAKYREIALNNGIQAKSQYGTNVIAPAAVITNMSSGGNEGLTSGAMVVKTNQVSMNGTYAHEVLHTLGPDDNGYDKGGILNSPPEPIIPSEVDQVLNDAYDKR